MAWTVQKASGNHTGYYRDAVGQVKSAGTSKSQEAALTAAERAERGVTEGNFTDPLAGNKKMSVYFENRWIVKRRLELNGKTYYLSHYNARKFGIKKRFGQISVNKISQQMVQDWIDDMEKAGLSARTIRGRVATLQVILAAKRGVSAVRDGLRTDNPCFGIELPVEVPREVQIYTPDQVDDLVEALHEWWRLMVLFDSETGLRWGELIALRVSDVDFLKRFVTVSRVIVEVKKEMTGNGTVFAVKPYPKSKKPRVVGITPETIEMLSVHIKRRHLKSDDLLFAMPILKLNAKLEIEIVPQVVRSDVWKGGMPVSRHYFRRVWNRAVKQAGLPKRRRHDLRASFISWLLDNPALSPQQVMDIVGHDNWKTTRKYAKSLDRTQQAGVDTIVAIRERYRGGKQQAKNA